MLLEKKVTSGVRARGHGHRQDLLDVGAIPRRRRRRTRRTDDRRWPPNSMTTARWRHTCTPCSAPNCPMSPSIAPRNGYATTSTCAVCGGIDYDLLGGRNEELPILSQVIADRRLERPCVGAVLHRWRLRPRQAGHPETDHRAAVLPIFWQFIGIGKADFGALTALDELSGRVVDNAGFFAVDDVSRISDDQLYPPAASEFLDWLTAARHAGVCR